MDTSLNTKSRNVLEALAESNLLRLQVEQPQLWQRMFVGDLVKQKVNLLQYARYIRAGMKTQPGGSTAEPSIGRKRKATSPTPSKPQPQPNFTLGLSLCPFDLALSPERLPSSSSCGLGLSLAPFEVAVEPACPGSPLRERDECVSVSRERDERDEQNNTPPPLAFQVFGQPIKQHRGKENMRHLHIDTTLPEDDFAAQQLVQLQLTPPSMPRRHLYKDPRSLSPTGQHDMLELLAKTCCQEKTGPMTFFSFDVDDACLSPRAKRFKAPPAPTHRAGCRIKGKFDNLLLAVNNINGTDMKMKMKTRTPVPKAKSKGRPSTNSSAKKRRARKHH